MKAQMSNTGGAWTLYVALYTASRWPEHCWSSGAPIPTPAQRGDALGQLGYVVVPGSRWEWYEISRDLGDPASPVNLIAAVDVRPSGTLKGGAA